MKNNFHADPLQHFLQKPRYEFTKSDIVRFVRKNAIQMINFRYSGGDGRLKTLNFIIRDMKHLDSILSDGERVDGSSLFDFLEAGSSDLYVIPRYRSAFLNPFSEIPALDILCAFYDRSGAPLSSAPEHILRKARRHLADETGYELEYMAELEYYVISTIDDAYQTCDQRGYHESAPFVKHGQLRREAMTAIAQCGGMIKYGHSEVGNFRDAHFNYEQNEIEFLPTDPEDAADHILISKWVLRELAYRHGLTVTFAPKIGAGKAGSGMHIHMRLMKDGKNVTLQNGDLSDPAKRVIAGILDIAPALCAFGNTVPTSYLRLVPNQEAPTNICWGKSNRSALIRVPLGWSGSGNMSAAENPLQKASALDLSHKQTFELRSPDASADIHLLFAGLCIGALQGLRMPDAAARAEQSFVDVNIFDKKHARKQRELAQLPDSCEAAATALLERASVFTKHDIFPEFLIRSSAEKLKAYDDAKLREQIAGDDQKAMELARRFLHCG